MAFLTTTELADIRTHMEATLPDTCTIEYVTRASDGMGGWTKAWTARGTAIACRLSPAMTGAYMGVTQEKLQEGQAWVLSVVHDQTVAVSDRVTVDSSAYRVSRVNVNESEIALKRAYLVRWE